MKNNYLLNSLKVIAVYLIFWSIWWGCFLISTIIKDISLTVYMIPIVIYCILNFYGLFKLFKQQNGIIYLIIAQLFQTFAFRIDFNDKYTKSFNSYMRKQSPPYPNKTKTNS
jgi:hypothetical protein